MARTNEWAEINQSARAIVDWATNHKKKKKRNYVSLPVLDTPFLRALYVDLSMSQEQGVKILSPLAQGAKELKDILPLSFSKEAFRPVYDAAQTLKDQGETVVYKLPNMLNIMEGILPFSEMIKLTRRDPELFEALQDQVLVIMKEVLHDLDYLRVDVLYLFDSFGSYRMLGPNFYQEHFAEKMSELIDIEGQLVHSKLALSHAVSIPLQDCYGFQEEAGSHLYLASQNRQGDIQLIKPVRIKKETDVWN